MNDQPTSSGSRWEPTDPTGQPVPTEPVHDGPTYAGPSYAAAPGRMPGRSRAIIAGAAVGLLGVGALGGYAIGVSTTGGEGGETSVVDVDSPFGGHDGDRDDDFGGGLPPGFDPGQVPPELGQDGTFPDLDGDDEDEDEDEDEDGYTESGSRT